MKRWLREWLFADVLVDYQQAIDKIATLQRYDWERMDKIEAALSAFESQHNAEVAEIRERLEMGAKKRPSGRPFSVLQKVASMGAAARRGEA